MTFDEPISEQEIKYADLKCFKTLYKTIIYNICNSNGEYMLPIFLRLLSNLRSKL